MTERSGSISIGIQKEDLRVLAEMGHALWVDPRESQIATVETLSAVSLLDLSPERALERAAAALLERVTHRGVAANTLANLEAGQGMGQGFFRLMPEERFLLVALHLGRWSYARLGRVFGEESQKIEELAWSARLQLATAERVANYPSGASLHGPHCPEYDFKRPWTQRFLDEEVATGRERVFLQNHLMACDSCRQALTRCREFYYALEARLPRLSANDGIDRMIRDLEAVTLRGRKVKTPVELSFGETLAIFLRRTDVQLVLSAFVVLMALKISGRI
jgi:hypothetical protein